MKSIVYHQPTFTLILCNYKAATLWFCRMWLLPFHSWTVVTLRSYCQLQCWSQFGEEINDHYIKRYYRCHKFGSIIIW